MITLRLRIQKFLHKLKHKNCVYFSINGQDIFVLCYDCNLGHDKLTVGEKSIL